MTGVVMELICMVPHCLIFVSFWHKLKIQFASKETILQPPLENQCNPEGKSRNNVPLMSDLLRDH